MKRLFTLITLAFFPFLGFSQYSQGDWEWRDTWMNTDALFDVMTINEGDFVADIGCHEGYLSIRLANRVGEDGSVYAVDVREDRLETLKGILDDNTITNVNVVLGDYDNPNLPKNMLDAVIIMDTYHEMVDYMTILEHVKTSLKPGGKLVIVEKLKTRIKGKSRAAQTEAHSLSTKYVKKDMRKAGFKVIYENNDLGEWEEDPNKILWMLIATKD